MRREINRRRVLALLAATGVAASIPAESAPPGTLQWLAHGIDAVALRELGSGASSVETSQSLPVAGLLRDRSAPAKQLASEMRRFVLDDYTHGRTVNLSGWQVSRTEAYLYSALAQAQG
jgi:hypothetical protein